MKVPPYKIFLVAGELSGDALGAWYIKKTKMDNVEAVGGDFLKAANAKLYERFEKLNVVGVVEILKHIRFLRGFLNKLYRHIVENKFDEVVVVDFPGFNLRLIRKIKETNPEIKITYLSPPQVWIWGEWRTKKIKKYCDEVIVLYPFEVAWYKERDIDAKWLGYPFYDKLERYFDTFRENTMAIIPGSRLIEIKRLLPLFLRIARRIKLVYPELKFVLPLAESIDKDLVEKVIKKSGLRSDITIVQGEEKLKVLSSCRLALTKPGTITLELALLKVPAVVAYKASWISYFIAKSLVKIKYMSLPSLLLDKMVYPEFIQQDCKEKKIEKEIKSLLSKQDVPWQNEFDKLRNILRG